MILTFEKIKSENPTFRDVHVEEWGGEIRIAKPAPSDLIEVVALQEGLDRKDGGEFVDQAAGLSWGAELLSICIVDEEGNKQFDSAEGREYLKGYPFVVGQLVGPAAEICGIASKKKEAE